MQNGDYKLKSVSIVETISKDIQLLKVELENIDTELYIFNNYNDIAIMLDNNVSCTFREDLINGELKTVIANITLLAKATVLDRKEVGKLFVEDLPDLGSNIVFSDYNIGDSVTNAIVYCTNISYHSSKRSDWSEMTVLDKRRKSAKIRLFNPDSKTMSMKGKYIRANLRLTKFGFNADEVFIEESVAQSVNPEIALAQRYIENIIKDDALLVDYVSNKKLLDYIRLFDDIPYEVGFLMVITACELSFANELGNLTPTVNTELLKRAIILDKSYVLSGNREGNYNSDALQAILHTASHKIGRDKRLWNILQDEPKEEMYERLLFKKIKELADLAVKGYKTYDLLLSSDKSWR